MMINGWMWWLIFQAPPRAASRTGPGCVGPGGPGSASEGWLGVEAVSVLQPVLRNGVCFLGRSSGDFQEDFMEFSLW